jgi:hypothetical protein
MVNSQSTIAAGIVPVGNIIYKPGDPSGNNTVACTAYTLLPNFPNPFNPSTTIRFGLPERSHVKLTVCNPLGQEVATVVDGEKNAGYHEAVFDASRLASGVYLYRLQAGSFVETRKLLLVK